jgi:hypothetical protein
MGLLDITISSSNLTNINAGITAIYTQMIATLAKLPMTFVIVIVGSFIVGVVLTLMSGRLPGRGKRGKRR